MNSGKMLWFLSWVLWLGSLCAQTTVGTITGTIRDQSGAVLPGVEVKATDPATGRSWSGVSTEDGTYRITNLPPATYEVKAELTGFKTALQKEVKVEVAATQRVDLRLEIGELTEIVTVTGEASTINVEKGEVSAVVDAKKIVDLPLNGRNVFQLAQLQPGIFNVAGANAQSDVTAAGISASGTRFRDNNILLDGVTNNNDRQGGLTTITPNADTVQEFRVVSNNFSAEFGRSGGALVNVITRGGTNAFHGSVYEFHRNDNLDAANVFAAFNPATQKKNKPEFKRNQFGFTAGGPIWKNHTFFFGSYEGDRIPGGVNRRLTVETREFRDFVTRTRPNSIAARLFKEFPASGPPTQNIRDIGSPAPGAGTFGPPDGIPDIGEAFLIIPGFVSRDQYSGRLDHQFNQGKDTLVGRYYLNDLSEQRPGDNSVRGFLTFFDERDQNLGLMETHIFSPRVVNEFRFGFNRDPVVAVPNFPEIPDIAFDDGTAKFSQGFGYAIPLFFFLNTYQYNDIVSINHGNHGIKAGFELRRFQENSEFQLFTRGWFFFSNVLDFADDEPNLEFLRVDPNTGSPVGTPRGYRTLEWGAFIQDDWKVTPNFTLNVGLRYDNFGTLADIRDRISNLTFPSGSTRRDRVANASIRPTEELYETDNNNFAPRFGFGWDPTGRGGWALRGGFGLSYSRIWSNLSGNNRFAPPFSAVAVATPATLRYGIPVPGNPAFGRGLDPRGGLAATRDNIDGTFNADFPAPYTYNWFLGVQREFAPQWVVEVNYIAAVSHKQNLIQDINRFTGDLLDGSLDRLNPDFGAITHRENVVNSHFHGGTIQLNKRFSEGYALQAAYTFGKNIDIDSDPFNTAAQGENRGTVDVENLALDRGPASHDVSQRWAANFLWEIPFLRDRNDAAGAILGGWQTNAIVALQSGFPYSVFRTGAAGDYNRDGLQFDRPNTPSFGNSSGKLTTQQYINGFMKASDFPVPAPGNNGNLGRNTFRGPGFASVDFSLFKDFRTPWFTSEGSRIQFRTEIFNLFNRVNLGRPSSNLASTLFGKSNFAFSGRQIQFALKFLF